MQEPNQQRPAWSYLPNAVWIAALMLLFILGGAATWFHHSQVSGFIDTVLWWLRLFFFIGLGLAVIFLVRRGYNHYHDIKLKNATRKKVDIDLARAEEKLLQEKAKTLAFQQVPQIIKYAMEAGHNVKFGGVEVTNYLSNVHTVGTGQAPGLLTPPPIYVPEPHTFSSILANGFQPSEQGLHFGTNTESVVIPPGEDMCHVMSVARTGGGKTNFERLLEVQLLYAKQKVIVVDPNWQDIRVMPNGERYDYRPISSRLMMPPVTRAEDALTLMQNLANEVLDRQARKRHNIVTFPAIYVIIDELPFLAKFEKELMGAIGVIVRIGRNYGVYVIGAAQDVQNNTLETDEGAIRESFLTCLFGGGDMVSARVLLDMQKGEKLEEQGLGVKGLYYIIARGINYSRNRIRVPLADNDATYTLLGDRPSTSIYDIPIEVEHTAMDMVGTDLANGHMESVVDSKPYTTTRLITRPKKLDDEQMVSQVVEAWNAGHRSITKVAAATGMTPWKARVCVDKAKVLGLLAEK